MLALAKSVPRGSVIVGNAHAALAFGRAASAFQPAHAGLAEALGVGHDVRLRHRHEIRRAEELADLDLMLRAPAAGPGRACPARMSLLFVIQPHCHQSIVAPESRTALPHFASFARLEFARKLRRQRPWAARRAGSSLSRNALAADDALDLRGERRACVGGQLRRRKHAPPRRRLEIRCMPDSAMVGTSGSAGERVALLTAIARNFPPCMCGAPTAADRT